MRCKLFSRAFGCLVMSYAYPLVAVAVIFGTGIWLYGFEGRFQRILPGIIVQKEGAACVL